MKFDMSKLTAGGDYTLFLLVPWSLRVDERQVDRRISSRARDSGPAVHSHIWISDGSRAPNVFGGCCGMVALSCRHRLARHRLADLSLREPVVLHSARFELEHDRLHRRRHVLGLRHRVRRGQPVHRLLRLAVPRAQGQQSPLRAREHEARDHADRFHGDRRRGNADARACSSGASSSRCRRTRTTFEAVGKQWHWSFRLPGADNKLGAQRRPLHDRRQSARRRSRRSRRARTTSSSRARSCICPWISPCKLLLRSTDVLHDFAVPQFRVKMDLVPGLVTYQWFTPTVPGTYEILCEELCGIGPLRDARQDRRRRAGRLRHVARDAADVRADAGAAGRQRDGGRRELRGLLGVPRPAGRGQPAAQRAEARGPRRLVRPPPAAALSARRSRHRRTGDPFGAADGADVADSSPTRRRARTCSRYIETLPDTPAPPTVTGDVEHGRRLFQTCSACHGDEGRGPLGHERADARRA